MAVDATLVGFSDLSDLVLAAGALGAASYGLVDTLKWTPLGRAGFPGLMQRLSPITPALAEAYGANFGEHLEAQFRAGRSSGELPKTLRQGVRIGLKKANASEIAKAIGFVDLAKLEAVADLLDNNKTPDEAGRAVLARFELAVDTRIEAALGVADANHANWLRAAAAAFSIVLALAAAYAMDPNGKYVLPALVAGAAAVPLAPLAKDLAKVIGQLQKALRGKS